MPASGGTNDSGGIDMGGAAGQREDLQHDTPRYRTRRCPGCDQRNVIGNVQKIASVRTGQTPAQHVGYVVRRPTNDSVPVNGGGELVEPFGIEKAWTDLDVSSSALTAADRRDDPHRQRSQQTPAHVFHHRASRLLVGHTYNERPAAGTSFVVDFEAYAAEVAAPLMFAVNHSVL